MLNIKDRCFSIIISATFVGFKKELREDLWQFINVNKMLVNVIGGQVRENLEQEIEIN